MAHWRAVAPETNKQTSPGLKINGQFISVTALIDEVAFEVLNFVFFS